MARRRRPARRRTDARRSRGRRVVAERGRRKPAWEGPDGPGSGRRPRTRLQRCRWDALPHRRTRRGGPHRVAGAAAIDHPQRVSGAERHPGRIGELPRSLPLPSDRVREHARRIEDADLLREQIEHVDHAERVGEQSGDPVELLGAGRVLRAQAQVLHQAPFGPRRPRRRAGVRHLDPAVWQSVDLRGPGALHPGLGAAEQDAHRKRRQADPWLRGNAHEGQVRSRSLVVERPPEVRQCGGAFGCRGAQVPRVPANRPSPAGSGAAGRTRCGRC